jgi:hypothetical protein
MTLPITIDEILYAGRAPNWSGLAELDRRAQRGVWDVSSGDAREVAV